MYNVRNKSQTACVQEQNLLFNYAFSKPIFKTISCRKKLLFLFLNRTKPVLYTVNINNKWGLNFDLFSSVHYEWEGSWDALFWRDANTTVVYAYACVALDVSRTQQKLYRGTHHIIVLQIRDYFTYCVECYQAFIDSYLMSSVILKKLCREKRNNHYK